MSKKNLFVLSFVALLLCSCDPPKAEKTVQKVKDIKEQYIKDIDNARSKEEAVKITREYNERLEFESSKLSDKEKAEYEKRVEWNQYKEMKDLNEEAVKARNRAKERFNKQK